MHETPFSSLSAETITLRLVSNSETIRRIGSSGPVSAAKPAYCAAAFTQEWSLIHKRVTWSTI